MLALSLWACQHDDVRLSHWANYDAFRCTLSRQNNLQHIKVQWNGQQSQKTPAGSTRLDFRHQYDCIHVFQKQWDTFRLEVGTADSDVSTCVPQWIAAYVRLHRGGCRFLEVWLWAWHVRLWAEIKNVQFVVLQVCCDEHRRQSRATYLALPSVYVLTSKLNTRNVRIFGDLILKEKANKWISQDVLFQTRFTNNTKTEVCTFIYVFECSVRN